MRERKLTRDGWESWHVVADGRIKTIESGVEGALPLALVSMATVNVKSWRPIEDALNARFHVIRHDVRGTGFSSPADPNGRMTIEAYADDLAGLLAAVGAGPALVCGIAFGGRIALQLAHRHGDLARGLILVGTSTTAPSGRAARRAGDREAARLRAEAGIGELDRPSGWFHHDDYDLAQKVFAAAAAQADQSHILAAIAAPSLVAVGAQDPNRDACRRIAKCLPDAELHEIACCGHGVPLQRPDELARLICDFAGRRLDGPPGAG